MFHSNESGFLSISISTSAVVSAQSDVTDEVSLTVTVYAPPAEGAGTPSGYSCPPADPAAPLQEYANCAPSTSAEAEAVSVTPSPYTKEVLPCAVPADTAAGMSVHSGYASICPELSSSADEISSNRSPSAE